MYIICIYLLINLLILQMQVFYFNCFMMYSDYHSCSQLVILQSTDFSQNNNQSTAINISQIATCFRCLFKGNFYLNDIPFVNNVTITIEPNRMVVHSWKSTSFKIGSLNIVSCRSQNGSSVHESVFSSSK